MYSYKNNTTTTKRPMDLIMNVRQVKDALASIQHLIGSLQYGLQLHKDTDEITEARLVEMQKIVNADFRRLRNGEPPITEVNHLKTRGKI